MFKGEAASLAPSLLTVGAMKLPYPVAGRPTETEDIIINQGKHNASDSRL